MHIQTRQTGPIITITLNRPDKRNALNQVMWRDVAEAVIKCSADPDVRAVILTGAGEHFTAGADIAEFDTAYATRTSTETYFETVKAATDSLAACSKPTIAAIRGNAFGGGVGLALACDLRFADASAQIAITPAKLGLCYPFGDVKRLHDLVGPSAAKDLLFSGRILTAHEALQLGLIDRLCVDLDSEASAYAATLRGNAPSSIMAMKQMLVAIANGQVGEDGALRDLLLNAVESADFAAGKAAFQTKRKPVF